MCSRSNQDTEISENTVAFRSRHVFESHYTTGNMKWDDRICCAPAKTSFMSFFPHRRLPCLIPVQKTSAGIVPLDLDPEVYKSNVQFPTLSTRMLLENTITPEQLTSKCGKSVPYDAFLPSCQQKVEGRTCTVCYKYHATKKSLQLHKKVCKRKKSGCGALKKVSKITARKSKYRQQEAEESDTEDDIDEKEVDTNNSFLESEEEEEELNTISIRPSFSMQGDGGIETILNLREWLKSPWAENE